MAPNIHLLSFFLLTFLLTNSPLASARDLPSSDISLVKQPEENYYIVKRKPVVITCQARNAADIIFTCMGTQIPPSSIETEDSPDFDPSVFQASIEVTRADVQNYDNGKDPFWCECSALDIDNQVAVTSRRAFVSIAALKHKFRNHPESVTATEGENVEFACGAPHGNPKPEIIWRKDRKRLNINANSRLLVTDLGNLVIESVIGEDAGNYQCVVRNAAGRRESRQAKLTVSVLAESEEPEVEISNGAVKPRIPRQSSGSFFTTEPDESYTVTEDMPAIIRCGVSKANILTFRCNNRRVNPKRQENDQGTDREGNILVQSNITVTFEEVQEFLMAQGGSQTKYQCICVAWTQGGAEGWESKTTSEQNGFVYLSYLDENFQAEPSDVMAGRGTDATMVCEPPRGQPSPWIQWFKDRVRIDPRGDDKYSVNSNGHLIIHDVQDSDAGNYNCVAQNTVTSRQSGYGRLIVTDEVPTTTPAAVEKDVFTFPDIIPSTAQFLQDVSPDNTIGPSGSVTLMCSAINVQHLTMSCGGARLTDDQATSQTEVDDETGARMIVTQVEVTNDMVNQNPDNYFCQCQAWFMENRQWNSSMGVEGYVRASPSYYIEDNFVVSPTDTEAITGSTARFQCEPPMGNPQPRVSWMKDGALWDYERSGRSIHFHKGILYIEQTIESDEGQYVCVAENEAGRRQSYPATLFLYAATTTQPPKRVTERTTALPDMETSSMGVDPRTPRFTVEPEPVSYVSKDMTSVDLHCHALGTSLLFFVCNGENIRSTATTGYQSEHPETGMKLRENFYTVTKEMVESYEGEEPYSCICRMVIGDTTRDSSPGVVEVSYLKGRFKQQPASTEVSLGGRLELTCTPPNGYPVPTVQWQKDGNELDENDSRILVDNAGSLVIEDFRESDVGNYVCIAENPARKRESQSAYVSLMDHDGSAPEPTPASPEPEPESTTDHGVHLGEPGTPFFSKDLHSVYYFVRNEPVTVKCEANNARSISIYCGGQNMNAPNRERVVGDENVAVGMIEVTKADARNYGDMDEFSCQCFAHYEVAGVAGLQSISSQQAFFETAYLQKKFQMQHANQMETVMEGSLLTLNCRPPMGHPEPKVSWMKDGVALEGLIQTPVGDLLFTAPTVGDSGEYQCVAENVVGRRVSEPIMVKVEAGVGATDETTVGQVISTMEGEDGEIVVESEPTAEPETDGVVDTVTPEELITVTESGPEVEPTGETSEWDGEKDGDDDDEAGENKGEMGENINVIEGTKGGCTVRMSECMKFLPGSMDSNFCKNIRKEEFLQCREDLYADCRSEINVDVWGMIDKAEERVRNCETGPQCNLAECKMIYSNSPGVSEEDGVLSIQNFCSDVSRYVPCVNDKLANCDVTMVSPASDEAINLNVVNNWFLQYCSRLIAGKPALDSCAEMNSCDIDVNTHAMDNNTYWCSFIDHLMECTTKAVNSCGLDELRNDLEELHAEARYETCSAEPTPEGEGDGVSEPETDGEGHPEGDPEGEPEGGPEGEPDGGSQGESDGGSQGESEGSDDGEPTLEGKESSEESSDESSEESSENEDMDNNDNNAYDPWIHNDNMYERTFQPEIYDTTEILEETTYYRWDEWDDYETTTLLTGYGSDFENNPDYSGKKNEQEKESENENPNYSHNTFDVYDEIEEGKNADGDGQGNMDIDGQGNMEDVGAEASSDPNNGSPALYSSAFLATFLQLLVAAILSQR